MKLSGEMLRLPSLLLVCFSLNTTFAQDTANTITRNQFNFGHQLGYMYSRIDDAWFDETAAWRFETGFAALYTSEMPRVRNNKWKERTMLYIPLYVEFYLGKRVTLQVELTDLFVEFPYESIKNAGGKSPRVKTKIGLMNEGRIAPAIAFTVGVKFSSAKPYVIWARNHTYDESNGLAGAGTGVADYLLLFTFSKKFSDAVSLHTHLGLAPLGSPVEYTRGSAQADEIPYGISLRYRENTVWSVHGELCGMYNGLPATKLAHYSMARVKLLWKALRHTIVLTLEHGLTEESDEWGAGISGQFAFGKRGE
jgi:hypothetical protein